MHHPPCPKCDLDQSTCSIVRRDGVYFRTSDNTSVQRFRCLGCKINFSDATYDIHYRQKKRHLNEPLRIALGSHITQRRAAKNLAMARSTIAKKAFFLSLLAEFRFAEGNREKKKAKEIEFDDLETFEHTKCKPLSVTLAVESKTRRILGIEVSVMPAKGRLSKKSRALYGHRPDLRREGRRRLFERIKPLVEENALIKSDSNPHYPKDVKALFPKATHVTYKGKRGAITGQGELKKVKFDPLFSLNHTCAMLRANISRLIRKTWTTTKDKDRLYAHLMVYAQYHNDTILNW